MPTLPDALADALEHHQAGRLLEAEQIYRQILNVDPQFADAWHLLGVLAHQVGRHDIAVDYIGRAIELDGTNARFHSNLGNVLKHQGRLEEAIVCCRRSMELEPEFAEAHNNLGTALKDQGKLDEAIAGYRQALKWMPHFAEAHNNLGVALLDQKKLSEAIVHLRRAQSLALGSAEVHNNLGVALKDQGSMDEAIACYRRAVELRPHFAEAHNNLGVALREQGELKEAIACHRRSLELQPSSADAHNNLGNALADQRKWIEADVCHRRALELRPDFAEAHFNLGNVLRQQEKTNEAIACFHRALDLKPTFAKVRFNLGVALKETGKLDEAAACYRQLLVDRPEYAAAYDNLGTVLKDQGNLLEAIACHRRAVELEPDFAQAHSNVLYTLHFCPDQSASDIYAEHAEWNRVHAQPLSKHVPSHSNDRTPHRRLKIGYVSPDFKKHPVGRFLLPLFEEHDHQNFDVHCYASVSAPDTITDLCHARADRWRNVLDCTDEQVAQIIRQDEIDILIDLSMHMANNHLLVFARKPAPVQVTYLAYCSTTGLSTIDYRFTDSYLDPPGQNEEYYSEQSVRLAETYWCYRPVDGAPAVKALPMLSEGTVTFGCLNNFAKVTAPTLDAWAHLLRAMPILRLLLHAGAGSHRHRVQQFMIERQVAPSRVQFMEKVGGADYFHLYHNIDVALDPFPYGGGTTTCDALWMGAPVVSLAGRTAVGRGGLSILSNIGLPNLVAHDCDQYVQIAVDLARDLTTLDELRGTLRERMQHSPLMNAPRFARNIEAAYRSLWQKWCDG